MAKKAHKKESAHEKYEHEEHAGKMANKMSKHHKAEAKAMKMMKHSPRGK